MTFGTTQGVTPESFLEVISQCADTSWMLENRAPHIAADGYTAHSAVDIWPKDPDIVTDIARETNLSAPLAAALQQFIAPAGSGLSRAGDSAVAKVFSRNVGVTHPGPAAT